MNWEWRPDALFLSSAIQTNARVRGGRDRLADSADLWDMARAIIMAGYTGENDTRYLSHEKSSYAGQMETVLFTVENGLPVVTGYSNLRDADYVQQRAWRDTPEEKPNAELLNALVELADPAGRRNIRITS